MASRKRQPMVNGQEIHRPHTDAVAELTELRQRADKQDALVLELTNRIKQLEGKRDTSESKRRSKNLILPDP